MKRTFTLDYTGHVMPLDQWLIMELESSGCHARGCRVVGQDGFIDRLQRGIILFHESDDCPGTQEKAFYYQNQSDPMLFCDEALEWLKSLHPSKPVVPNIQESLDLCG